MTNPHPGDHRHHVEGLEPEIEIVGCQPDDEADDETRKTASAMPARSPLWYPAAGSSPLLSSDRSEGADLGNEFAHRVGRGLRRDPVAEIEDQRPLAEMARIRLIACASPVRPRQTVNGIEIALDRPSFWNSRATSSGTVQSSPMQSAPVPAR